MTDEDKPRFVILDHGDEQDLPVVAARLNLDCGLRYDGTHLTRGQLSTSWIPWIIPQSFTWTR